MRSGYERSRRPVEGVVCLSTPRPEDIPPYSVFAHYSNISSPKPSVLVDLVKLLDIGKEIKTYPSL